MFARASDTRASHFLPAIGCAHPSARTDEHNTTTTKTNRVLGPRKPVALRKSATITTNIFVSG